MCRRRRKRVSSLPEKLDFPGRSHPVLQLQVDAQLQSVLLLLLRLRHHPRLRRRLPGHAHRQVADAVRRGVLPRVNLRHVRNVGTHGGRPHRLRRRGRPEQPRVVVERPSDAVDARRRVASPPCSRLPSEGCHESQKFAGDMIRPQSH